MAEKGQAFGEALGLAVTAVQPIQTNAYCAIYRAHTPAGQIIIKEYGPEQTHLAATEAQGLRVYHDLARGDPDLLDSGAPALSADGRVVGIGFVPGERLTEVIRRGRRDEAACRQAVHAMTVLARFLERLREHTTVPGGEVSPFLREYLSYCSARLARVPLAGRWLFARYPQEVDDLWNSLRQCGLPTSFAHGDLVCRNIHVSGDRVGVIDFANTNDSSHTLNDLCNLRIALLNMRLSAAYRQRLWAPMAGLLEAARPPRAARRFYYEYHRRRWLMLKLCARHPAEWLQALRGMLLWARPLSAAEEGDSP
jgi:hypothetical protein